LDPSHAVRFLVFPLPKQVTESVLAIKEQNSSLTEVSDESLLAQICIGEGEALAILFQRYGRLVRSAAARILRDTAEAEDLVQELFLFIQRKCGIFDSSKSSARSWIVQMAYHRAIERRRYLVTCHFYAHAAPSTAEQLVGAPTTESDYSEEVVFDRNGLEKVVEALSEDQRETMRLYFFEGYTLAEIGQKLGQPRENVRHHYYRGLAKLRKAMSGSTVRVAGRHGK
jgi:RNA polymerase sigma-70 factor (ECF subfamily)